MLADGQGGEHGMRLSTRNHYRMVAETPEVASKDDLVLFRKAKRKLGGLAEEPVLIKTGIKPETSTSQLSRTYLQGTYFR